MKATQRSFFILVFFFLMSPVCAPAVYAQAEEDDAGTLAAGAGEQYVRGYATGLVETSAAALGSGLFFENGQATDLLGPVNLYLGLRAAAVPYRDGERTFSLNRDATGQIRLADGTLTEVQYSYDVDVAPTALGEYESGPEAFVTARYRNAEGNMTTEEFRFAAPQGLLGYVRAVPSVVPQAGIGVPALGLRISARYTPTLAYEDVPGRLNNVGVRTVEGALWGVGARQSVDAWIDALPFGLSVYGFYQHIGISTQGEMDQDVLSFDMLSGGVNFSKSILAEAAYSFSVFATAGAETSTAHFTYETAPEGDSFASVVDFSIDNPIGFRTQAGFSTRYGPLMFNLGYAPTPRSTFLGGVGVSL